jgi:hypothetical protein
MEDPRARCLKWERIPLTNLNPWLCVELILSSSRPIAIIYLPCMRQLFLCETVQGLGQHDFYGEGASAIERRASGQIV